MELLQAPSMGIDFLYGTVNSKTIYAGLPSSQGFGVGGPSSQGFGLGGQSYSNFLTSTVKRSELWALCFRHEHCSAIATDLPD